MKRPTIAVLGSHSALDVCRGAKDEGFNTLVIAEEGREKTYTTYYKTTGDEGCIDECIVLNKFSDIIKEKRQKELAKRNVIFVPNRSFEVYLDSNYDHIEKDWHIPLFGNKYLLRIEERAIHPNQYDLLAAANIRYPKHFSDPKTIDCLSIVKASEKERSFERAFFLVSSYEEYLEKSQRLLSANRITPEGLKGAVIEEFVVGAQINFNFFYSPVKKRIELLGTDTRRQTNLDGLLRIPASTQLDVLENVDVSYEEAGHIAVTVLESLLEKAFAMAERFVTASQQLASPGIIGPFALQSIITAGPPKKDIIVIDVSPRMPGSPGIAATPYGQYFHGKPISVGRRVAIEIKDAIENNLIHTITT